MLGGGCGEQLAHWIIQGRPELHMYAYDIRSVFKYFRQRLVQGVQNMIVKIHMHKLLIFFMWTQTFYKILFVT